MSDAPAPQPAAAPAPTADPAIPPAPVIGGPAPAPVVDPAQPTDPATPAPAPVVPEKYEFVAPEIDGKPAAIDPAALASFEVTAREAGLTQEQFQAVTKAGAEKIAELAAGPYRVWADQQRAWKAEINADAEIGGDKLAPSLAHAAKALDAFGGDTLRQALVVTGAGNNPAIVRAFVAIGKAMGDPTTFHTGGPAGGAKPKSGEQAARDIYNAGGGSYPDVTA